MKYKRGTLVGLLPDNGLPSRRPNSRVRGIVLEAQKAIRPLPVYLIKWTSEPTPEWVYEESLCEV